MSIGYQLLNVPMGDMIRQMALAIAEAQLALDESSVQAAELMSGRSVVRDEEGNPVMEDSGQAATESTTVYFGREEDGTPIELSMMELGFTPTFYQFIDTIIEVKIAISITRESEFTRTTTESANRRPSPLRRFFSRGSTTVRTTQVDATYSSKYSYSAEGSSLLRTKLTPVPPPAVLEERVRRQLEIETDRRERNLDE